MAALEPVIATLIANTAEFTEGLASAKAEMAEFAATATASGDAAGAGLATGAKEGAAGLEGDLGAAGVAGGLAAREGVDSETGKLGEDLEKTGDEAGGKFSNAMSGGLEKIANLISNTGLPLGSLSEGLGKSSEATKELDSSSGSLFQTMSGVGKVAFLGLAAAGAAAAVEGVHLATSMQSADTAIAVASGTTVQSAQKIGQAFLSTAGQSEFSGLEMAQAFGQVAGQLKATEGSALTTTQAMQVMSAAGDLATAKQISLGTATTTVAATMQAFQLNTTQAAGVSDLLLNASDATGQSVTSLGSALDKTKTKLGGMSPPVQQLSGLLVDLYNHGESGRAAMSALTTTFTNFLKPAAAVATAQNELNSAVKQLPPNLQSLGQQVASGTLTSAQYTAATKNLSATQLSLIGNVKTAQAAMTTAAEAQTKMGITATNAQGQLLPLSNIMGQLQEKIKGMSTGQAIATLTSMGFTSASAKLVETIQAGPAALDAATNSTTKAGSAQKAAAEQAKTLSVEFKTIKATAENVLTEFGQFLIPVIQTLGQTFVSVSKFVLDHKDALYALGVLVGGFLTLTIGAFAINTMASLVSSIASAGSTVASFGSNLLGLGGDAETSSETTTTAVDAAATSLEAAATSMEAAAATITESFAGIGAAATTMAADVSASTAEADASMETMAATAETSAAEIDTSMGSVDFAGAAGAAEGADAAIGEAGLAGGMGEAGAAAGGLTGVLGPLGLAVGVVTLGAMALGNALHSNTNPAWVNQTLAAKSNATTIAGLQTQLAQLTSAQNAAAKAIGNGTLQAQIAPQAYSHLGGEIDKVKSKLSEATTNVQELSNITGLSQGSIQSLATTLGVNLTQALSPATIEKFNGYVQANGGVAAVTGQEWTASAALIKAALEQTEQTAAKAMPGISTAAQQMVSTTQPKLVELVSDLDKSGDGAGGAFVSAFLSHLTPAQLASKNIHNAVTSPLLPLETELRSIGDTAAANQVAAFISHIPAAAAAAYTMKGNILGPLNGIVADMQTTGDNAGMNLVQAFLNHNPDALAAANEVHGSIASKLQPLETELQQVGDVSGANIVAGIMKHDSQAQQQAQFMHDAIKNPLMPLEMELGTAGDSAAAAMIQDFAKHNPDAATNSKALHDALKSPLDALAAELSTDGDTAASNLVQAFVNGTSGAATTAAGIGQAIDSGVAGGITSGQQLVGAAAAGMAQQALQTAKHSVGISSPSKVASDEIGLPIAQGVAEGIARNAHLPAIAAVNMMQGVVGGASGTLGLSVAGTAAVSGGGAGAGGGTTVLNVTTPVQVAGQTLAQIVTQYQLRGARATGNALGQYAGGTQQQTATSINPNAPAR